MISHWLDVAPVAATNFAQFAAAASRYETSFWLLKAIHDSECKKLMEDHHLVHVSDDDWLTTDFRASRKSWLHGYSRLRRNRSPQSSPSLYGCYKSWLVMTTGWFGIPPWLRKPPHYDYYDFITIYHQVYYIYIYIFLTITSFLGKLQDVGTNRLLMTRWWWPALRRPSGCDGTRSEGSRQRSPMKIP